MDLKFWLVMLGFLGQFLFFLRFFVQWVASEKEKKSVIPMAFWYFSLAGSIILLIYAVCRRDPVFTVGQSMGILIYSRNLMLIAQHKTSADQA